MGDLLAIILNTDHPETYDAQMKAMSDEIVSLQDTLAKQEERGKSDEFSRKIEDIRTALRNAPFEITEYSDNAVRQMIDTIKVMNENKLLIIFKGGFEVEQPLHI